MILKYSKIRSGVFTPERANPSDAGLDLFYSPDENCYNDYDPLGNFLDTQGRLKIPVGRSVLIPTGIKLEIPYGYCFEIKNRSGNASKKQLLVGACVVDSGYEGEIFVNLHNFGHGHYVVNPGMKVAQGILLHTPPFRLHQVPENEIYNDPITISNRGDGALGSTDG